MFRFLLFNFPTFAFFPFFLSRMSTGASVDLVQWQQLESTATAVNGTTAGSTSNTPTAAVLTPVQEAEGEKKHVANELTDNDDKHGNDQADDDDDGDDCDEVKSEEKSFHLEKAQPAFTYLNCYNPSSTYNQWYQAGTSNYPHNYDNYYYNDYYQQQQYQFCGDYQQQQQQQQMTYLQPNHHHQQHQTLPPLEHITMGRNRVPAMTSSRLGFQSGSNSFVRRNTDQEMNRQQLGSNHHHHHHHQQQQQKQQRRRIATVEQRRAANVRERKRMMNLNESFNNLRAKVPTFAYERKLSRIETLRLAILYIHFMTEIVVNGRQPSQIELVHWTPREIQQQQQQQQQGKGARQNEIVKFNDSSTND